MRSFLAAKQRVEMAPARTWLEQVHGNNNARRTMKANHPFHDKVYLGKTDGRFNDVPADLHQAVWTGTAAVIGAKGGKLAKFVETECEFEGHMKVVLFETNEEQQAADPDIVFMCNQGFARGGLLYLPLSNAQTNKPIANDDEMQEAEVVKMRFNGTVSQKKVKIRYGGAFEQTGDEHSQSWFFDNAVLGLLRRVVYSLDLRRDVYLAEAPFDRLRVAVKAAAGLIEQLKQR